MKVQVRLFANLRQYGPGGSDFFVLEIPQQATVEQLVKILEIPPRAERVILVNGRQAKAKICLADKDTVTMFPPMAGG
ncbi:MAG: MoaD/ThiS family protein [Desulfobacterales bacterium]|nr:MoaD/ThiS family protein [Desulfobacterales bacterium]